MSRFTAWKTKKPFYACPIADCERTLNAEKPAVPPGSVWSYFKG